MDYTQLSRDRRRCGGSESGLLLPRGVNESTEHRIRHGWPCDHIPSGGSDRIVVTAGSARSHLGAASSVTAVPLRDGPGGPGSTRTTGAGTGTAGSAKLALRELRTGERTEGRAINVADSDQGKFLSPLVSPWQGGLQTRLRSKDQSRQSGTTQPVHEYTCFTVHIFVVTRNTPQSLCVCTSHRLVTGMDAHSTTLAPVHPTDTLLRPSETSRRLTQRPAVVRVWTEGTVSSGVRAHRAPTVNRPPYSERVHVSERL